MRMTRLTGSRGRANGLGLTVLFAIALAVRLLLAHKWPGFYSDQRLFVQWWQSVDQYGVADAYAQNASINYPPLYLWLLEGYGKLIGLFSLTPQEGALSYKMLPIAIDMAALAAAVPLTSVLPTRWRWTLLALFAFNPAVLIDGAVWGQIDMLHGMLMVLAAATIVKRPWFSGLCAALALLTKFQAIVILPVLGVYLLVHWARTRRPMPLVQWGAGLLLPWLAADLIFRMSDGLNLMFRQAYANAVGEYAYASMNAMNLWFHIAGVKPGDSDTTQALGFLTYRQLGLCLFGAAALLVCAYAAAALLRGRPATAVMLKAGAAINLAFFLLPTEMHERYGIPALLLAIFAAAYDRRWLAPAAALTATFAVNLAAVLHMSGGRGFGVGADAGEAWRRPLGNVLDRIGAGEGFRGPPGAGFGGRMNFKPSAGPGQSLPVDYAWVAGANLAILLLLFWLLWLDLRAAPASDSNDALSGRAGYSPSR